MKTTQSTETTREHFFKILRGFNDGMFITHSTDGELHARPMAIAAIEDDGDVWLATDVHSSKVEELSDDAHVGLALQASGQYLALAGTAEVVRDANKAKALWNEAWRVWFPQGPDDASLILIRVKTQRGEYWDNKGLGGIRYLYEAAKAYVTGTTPPTDADQQAKLDLQ